MLVASVKTRSVAEELFKDPDKFKKFAEQNKRFLMDIVSKIRDKDNYDLDDLYQESLIALYYALETYDPEKRIEQGKKAATFSTYSYRIIKNEIIHYINEQNKILAGERSIETFKTSYEDNTHTTSLIGEQEIFGYEKTEGFEAAVIDKMDNERIMSKLSSLEKDIFEKKLIQNLTHDEVAAELKLPTSTYMTIYYKSFVPKIKAMGYEMLETMKNK